MKIGQLIETQIIVLTFMVNAMNFKPDILMELTSKSCLLFSTPKERQMTMLHCTSSTTGPARHMCKRICCRNWKNKSDSNINNFFAYEMHDLDLTEHIIKFNACESACGSL